MEQLSREQESAHQASKVCERAVGAIEAEMKQARGDREEMARQHASDKELLSNIFRELEVQLSVARTEREELQSRSERERRVMAKRVRELEEALHAEKARYLLVYQSIRVSSCLHPCMHPCLPRIPAPLHPCTSTYCLFS